MSLPGKIQCRDKWAQRCELNCLQKCGLYCSASKSFPEFLEADLLSDSDKYHPGSNVQCNLLIFLIRLLLTIQGYLLDEMNTENSNIESLRQKILETEKQLETLAAQLAQAKQDSVRHKPDAENGGRKWPLSAEEYNRYGRQMIVPSIGIGGESCLQRIKQLLTSRRPASSSWSECTHHWSRWTWLSSRCLHSWSWNQDSWNCRWRYRRSLKSS